MHRLSPEVKPDAAAWPLHGRPSPDDAVPGFRGALHLDPEHRAAYGEASGIVRVIPDAVAVPRDAEDVAALVRWAGLRGVPLVPRGAGTGMPGGNVGRGVAVDLAAGFRRVGAVDADARTARVAPGVTLAELNAAAEAHGLHFPVDPSSGERCTFGGMIANNSGGAHTVLYGATRAWVRSLDLVLADGTRVATTRGEAAPAPRLREIVGRIEAAVAPHRAEIEARWPRVRKNSSGYALREWLASGDALDLLVGSEGTLALVMGAELRLAPLPAARGLALLELTSLEAAGAAVERILELAPSACEMIDRTFIDLVRAGGEDPGYPLREGLEAILFVEMEGESDDEVRRKLERLRGRVAGSAHRVSIAEDAAQRSRFWHVRHAASPLIARLAGGRVSMQFIEDGVVPVARLADYVRLLRRVLAGHGLPAVIFGHAGDGNLHVNPLVDVTRPGWRDEVERVIAEVAEGVAALGGTLAGEHGDGRLRAPLLETIWGAELVACFRAVKEAFDPRGILNPGVILPLPGQRPLDGVMY
ncbi:MAG TPA: FAD-binding oxidoreductase [Longimicrobiaceae bacterium]|nr:FAD-binding oxidoreductase [Longimicrobiaceae bacterium]